MKPVIKAVLCQLFLFFLLVPAAWCDEIEDAVQEGIQYYRDGDFSSAAGSLEYAAQLIRQKKGGELESLLPEPLPGWTAENTSSQATGAAMFGGGVSAERIYRKENSQMTVQIVTDSPILQGVMMMLTNPAVAASSGGKLKRINNQKAIVNYAADSSSGELQIVVAGRFLVSVNGSDITQDELEGYAEAIDFKKMADL